MILERTLEQIGQSLTKVQGNTDNRCHGKGYVVKRNIVHRGGVLTSVNELERCEIEDDLDQLKKGDVIFTTSGSNALDTGKAVVIDFDISNVYIGDFLFGWRPAMKFNPYWLSMYLNENPDFRRQIAGRSQMGTSLANLKKSDVFKCKINISPIDQQNIWGKYLKEIGKQISTAEKQLEQDKQMKKYFLDNLFV